MKIEKMVNSKFYRGFEWFYRLILLNLLILLISFIVAAIPFLYWYYKCFDTGENGIIVLVAVILFVIALIPTFITSFLVIKHYMDDKTGNIFVVFFKYLIDTIKKVYLIAIILVTFLVILSVGLYINWQLLSPENYQNDIIGYATVVSFAVQVLLVALILLVFINLTYIVAYFRMRAFDYFKLSLKFSFRYMMQSIVSFLFLLIPVLLLSFMGMKFLPIYFISGISLPQLCMYLLVRKRFDYLANNLKE